MKQILMLMAIMFAANMNVNGSMIKNGDFSSDGNIEYIDSKWDLAKHDTGKWYSWHDKRKGGFYNNKNGYATIDRSKWDKSCFDAKQVKLMQVIKGPGFGTYNLDFDYQISDAKKQYSVFRVFGVTKGHNGKFKVNMRNWDAGVSYSNAERLYDQGGKYSYLQSTDGWEHVASQINVTKSYDYLVVYAALSYDGKSSTNDMVGLDNISMVEANAIPEPATLMLLSVGFLGIALKRRTCA